jgi:hypothetical protein
MLDNGSKFKKMVPNSSVFNFVSNPASDIERKPLLISTGSFYPRFIYRSGRG